MLDFEKIYILTTGKFRDEPNLIFRDIARPISITHPVTTISMANITYKTVNQLFELTKFETAENLMNSPNTSNFKMALTNDWIKAYNEFGIEIDDYLTKVFDDTEDYADGEVPVWDSSLKEFKPGSGSGGPGGTTSKQTELTVVNTIPAMTPITVSTSNFYVNKIGDVPDLRADSINFISDITLQIELNGLKQNKTTQVVRINSTQIYFNERLDIGETIFIVS